MSDVCTQLAAYLAEVRAQPKAHPPVEDPPLPEETFEPEPYTEIDDEAPARAGGAS